MTQTEPRTISFIPDDVLFQYFTKEYLDVEEELVKTSGRIPFEYQSPFARKCYLTRNVSGISPATLTLNTKINYRTTS